MSKIDVQEIVYVSTLGTGYCNSAFFAQGRSPLLNTSPLAHDCQPNKHAGLYNKRPPTVRGDIKIYQ